MRAADLTVDEQKNVRVALRVLHVKFGTWAPLAKALRFDPTTLSHWASGTKPVTVLLTFRIAKLLNVPVDDILTGRYPPPGTCPLCGHGPLPQNADGGGAP